MKHTSNLRKEQNAPIGRLPDGYISPGYWIENTRKTIFR